MRRMSTPARIVVSLVCAVVLVVATTFAIAYHAWSGRGDRVQFSATGNLGLGTEPIVETNSKGQKVQIGANHNYLFVRDTYIDRSTFGKFSQ